MANLSLGQKAVVIGILGVIAVFSVALFVSTGLGGKVLALLVLGTCLSGAYKISHM